jgi:hypothetical protein
MKLRKHRCSPTNFPDSPTDRCHTDGGKARSHGSGGPQFEPLHLELWLGFGPIRPPSFQRSLSSGGCDPDGITVLAPTTRTRRDQTPTLSPLPTPRNPYRTRVLRFEALESTPVLATLTRTAQTSATFNYSDPDDPVSGLTVTCTLNGSPVTCSSSGVTLTGLAPGNAYTFVVIATHPWGSNQARWTWRLDLRHHDERRGGVRDEYCHRPPQLSPERIDDFDIVGGPSRDLVCRQHRRRNASLRGPDQLAGERQLRPDEHANGACE